MNLYFITHLINVWRGLFYFSSREVNFRTCQIIYKHLTNSEDHFTWMFKHLSSPVKVQLVAWQCAWSIVLLGVTLILFLNCLFIDHSSLSDRLVFCFIEHVHALASHFFLRLTGQTKRHFHFLNRQTYAQPLKKYFNTFLCTQAKISEQNCFFFVFFSLHICSLLIPL